MNNPRVQSTISQIEQTRYWVANNVFVQSAKRTLRSPSREKDLRMRNRTMDKHVICRQITCLSKVRKRTLRSFPNLYIADFLHTLRHAYYRILLLTQTKTHAPHSPLTLTAKLHALNNPTLPVWKSNTPKPLPSGQISHRPDRLNPFLRLIRTISLNSWFRVP